MTVKPEKTLFRITCTPVASFTAIFQEIGDGPSCQIDRVVERIHILGKKPKDFGFSMLSFEDPSYSVFEALPKGIYQGSVIQELKVANAYPGHQFRFHFLNDNNYGDAQITLEVFDKVWKQIVKSPITSDLIKVTITW